MKIKNKEKFILRNNSQMLNFHKNKPLATASAKGLIMKVLFSY